MCRKHLPGIYLLWQIDHDTGKGAQKITGLSLAPALAIRIILLNKGARASTHSNNSKSKGQITSPQRKALLLTQISEFFSLPPLALFRSLIQVAFISQTAPFPSAAAAPGTDPQCALSPAEQPPLLPQPCSGQAPLLSPFLPPGRSLPTPEDSDPRRFLFSHSRWENKHSNALGCFKNNEHLKCVQRPGTNSFLNLMYLPTLKSLFLLIDC